MLDRDIEDTRGEDMYITYLSPDDYEERIGHLEGQIAKSEEDYDVALSERDDIIEDMAYLLAKAARTAPDEVKAEIAIYLKRHAGYLRLEVCDA